MKPTDVITPGEIQAVTTYGRVTDSLNRQMNLTIFRLACGAGLRRKEIRGLNLGDIILSTKPSIEVRAAITKGREGKRRPRTVPLWWDRGTLDDIAAWYRIRVVQGASPTDPFVCSQRDGDRGRRLSTAAIAARWHTALTPLGAARQWQVSIHAGRHSFITNYLHAGKPLIAVRDAAGHANFATTNGYAHEVTDVASDGIPDTFGTE